MKPPGTANNARALSSNSRNVHSRLVSSSPTLLYTSRIRHLFIFFCPRSIAAAICRANGNACASLVPFSFRTFFGASLFRARSAQRCEHRVTFTLVRPLLSSSADTRSTRTGRKVLGSAPGGIYMFQPFFLHCAIDENGPS